MRAVRQFEEFIKEGIARKQSKDRPRAEFLIKESGQSRSYMKELIKKMGIDENNANNYVKNCYDIIMEMIRAKMLLEGYNASGAGAHESEVSYMRELGFNEKDVQFADQLRFFRNGMLYYGKILDKEYAEKVISFTERIYAKLKDIINK